MKIAHYEVVDRLGAGGMGEVYRARDPKLGRDVAIKVLPAAFLQDPERRMRFEREARILASINHPHIGAIYGVEDAEGQRALVLELIEGETLSARIESSGHLPVDEALGIAAQIADALDAAHEKGIVHRDLKPANIMLTQSGAVKVLDFGLARLGAAESSSSLATSPTLTFAGTLQGVILGTAIYLSPEQARGRAVDKRTDIWAFGCVLFEMLSGQRAFDRDTVTDSIAAIIHQEPDWKALPDDVPERVRQLLRRCLTKDPRRRLHDIADARIEIEEVLSSPQTSTPASPADARAQSVRSQLPWILFAAASLALLVVSVMAVRSWRRAPSDASNLIKFTLMPPGGVSFSPTAQFVAVSPDGNYIAIVATNSAGVPVVWVRARDALEPRPLAGTEGARQPFWSPDSRFVGFCAAGGYIKKVAVAGGPPQTLMGGAIATCTGATWSRDGVILLSSVSGPIQRISASPGSKPVAVTPVADLKTRVPPAFPHFLPDGKRFLYYVRSPVPDEDGIYVADLNGSPPRLVIHASSNVAYVPSGHLLYVRDDILLAHPFDPTSATTIGEPEPVAEGVEYLTESGIAAFSASDTGVLVYRSSSAYPTSRLVWFDRTGKRLGEFGDPAPIRNPRLSPDGKRVAAEIVDRSGNRDIWILDTGRAVPMRFTFDRGRDAAPVWSADGRKIVWQGSTAMYVKSSDGKGEPQRLLDQAWIPDEWLPDGSGLLCHPPAPLEIFFLDPSAPNRAPQKMIEGNAITTQARISPDGKWIAYVNADTGRFEVILQDFPKKTGRWQVTNTGGLQAKWRHDGKELFYLSLDGRLMAVPVNLGGLVEIGRPQVLFETQTETVAGYVWHQYDVSPDGQRFLVNVSEVVVTPVTVVYGWPALLK